MSTLKAKDYYERLLKEPMWYHCIPRPTIPSRIEKIERIGTKLYVTIKLEIHTVLDGEILIYRSLNGEFLKIVELDKDEKEKLLRKALDTLGEHTHV